MSEQDDGTISEYDLRLKLKELNTGEMETDILVYRLIHKMSFREIAEELGECESLKLFKFFKQTIKSTLEQVMKRKQKLKLKKRGR